MRDPEKRNPVYGEKTLAELIAIMRHHPKIAKDENGNAIEIPTHFLDRVIGETLMYLFFIGGLKAMREVVIVVPLDTPAEIRDEAINRIVDDWRKLRKGAGYDLEPRSTREGKINDLHGLPARIKTLRQALADTRAKKNERDADPNRHDNDPSKDTQRFDPQANIEKQRDKSDTLAQTGLHECFKDELKRKNIPVHLHLTLEKALLAALFRAASARAASARAANAGAD